MKKIYIIFTLILLTIQVAGQNVYPVRTYTVLTPPMPYSLSDFASEPGRVQLNINVDDISLQEYPVYFRLVIKGNGIKLYTKPNMYQEPLYLEGGMHEVLTGFDLKDLFNPQNLVFEGYSLREYNRTGRLPEGVYQMYVELWDYNYKINLSQAIPGIAVIYLTRAPRLTLPINKDQIDISSNPVIRFSWMGSMPSEPMADPIYRFNLYEIRPAGRNPYEIVRVSPPVFTYDTKQPYLLYDMGMPPLEEGLTYAWQVQAIDLEGRAKFQNDGLSEVFTFKYGIQCETPEVEIAGVNTSEVKLKISTNKNARLYRIYYKATEDEDWQITETNLSAHTIKNLLDNTGYEIKVTALCGDEESEESTPLRFKTNLDVDYTCGGSKDNFDVSNTEPLQNLYRYDFFKAADFTIQVSDVEGENGNFSGNGFALVPYLGFVKMAVKFNNIKINADRRMTEGTIDLVYNEKSGLVVGLENIFEEDEEEDTVDIDEVVEESTDKQIKVDGEITNVQISGNTVTVITKKGESKTITVEEGKTVGVVSKDGGTVYVADTGSGQVFTAPKPTGSKAKTGSVGTASQTGQYGVSAIFKAAKNQQYGFDQVSKNIKKKPEEYFKTNKSGDRVAWKSLATGRSDYLDVIIKSNAKDTLRYIRSSGMLASFNKSNEGDQLLLTGIQDGEEEILTAASIKKEQINDSTTNEILTEVGAIRLASYEPILKEVVLVSVNRGQCPTGAGGITNELNRLYAPAIVSWKVSIDKPFEYEGLKAESFKTEGTGTFSKYTSDMNKVIRAYKKARGVKKDTYYLFFIKEPQTKKQGFMPLTGQYGFIFNFGSNTTVLGHELGHGAFNLRHTFSDKAQYYFPERTTQNLMDYANGEELWKYQWDLIHNPEKILFSIFQDEDEGALVGEGFANYVCLDKIYIQELLNSGIDFLNMKGDPISLDGHHYPIAFMAEKEGKYYGRVGAIVSEGKPHLYGIKYLDSSKKEMGYELTGNYIGIQKSKYTPPKGDASKAYAVQIKDNGKYILKAKDGSAKPLKDAAIIDCPFTVGDGNGIGVQKTYVNNLVPEDVIVKEELLAKLKKICSGGEVNPLTGKSHKIVGKILLTLKGDKKCPITVTTEDNKDVYIVNGEKQILLGKELMYWLEYDQEEEKICVRKVIAGEDIADRINEIALALGNTVNWRQKDFLEKFVDVSYNTVDQVFTIQYNFLDFMAKAIGEAKIPDNIWNCTKSGYNPQYAEYFSYIGFIFVEDILFNYFKEQLPQHANMLGGAEISQIKFALFCGLYNGLVDVVKSVPDLLKLLTMPLSSKGRDDANNFIKTLRESSIKEKIGGEEKVIYRAGEITTGKIWYLVADGISKMFESEHPCVTAEFVGTIVGPIIVACVGDAAALEGPISKMASTVTKAFQLFDKLGDPIQYLGRFFNLKLVKAGTEPLMAVMTKGGKEFARYAGQTILITTVRDGINETVEATQEQLIKLIKSFKPSRIDELPEIFASKLRKALDAGDISSFQVDNIVEELLSNKSLRSNLENTEALESLLIKLSKNKRLLKKFKNNPGYTKVWDVLESSGRSDKLEDLLNGFESNKWCVSDNGEQILGTVDGLGYRIDSNSADDLANTFEIVVNADGSLAMRSIVEWEGFGGKIILDPNKTTTVMGRFRDPDGPEGNMNGTEKFTHMRVSRVGNNKGGIDVLDIDDWSWGDNAAWLNAAINRMEKGDGVIIILHDPRKESTFFKLDNEDNRIEFTITAMEMRLAMKRGYAPDPETGMLIPLREALDKLDKKTTDLWKDVETKDNWEGVYDTNEVNEKTVEELTKGSRERNYLSKDKCCKRISKLPEPLAKSLTKLVNGFKITVKQTNEMVTLLEGNKSLLDALIKESAIEALKKENKFDDFIIKLCKDKKYLKEYTENI